jgi:hypothetical protein
MSMIRSHQVLLGVLALSLFLPACGLGSAGIASAVDDGSGGSTTPVQITSFSVVGGQGPLADISFVLGGPSSQELPVRVEYTIDGVTGTAHLEGEDEILLLEPSPVARHYAWNYSAELGIAAGPEQKLSDVLVRAYVIGQNALPQVGVDAALVDLGNDPPEILSVVPMAPATPGDELSDNVSVTIAFDDSSDDVIDLQVQYRTLSPQGNGPWIFARPASTGAGEPTPTTSIENVPSADGSAIFVWDSDHDLPVEEVVVELSVSAIDPYATGDAHVGTLVGLDNNASPVAIIDASFAANPDRHRRVVFPVRVFDDESDNVRLVMQWRLANEPGFPPLPSSYSAILAAMSDPEQRALLHICDEQPEGFIGELSPLPAGKDASRQVRLPELANKAASLLALGFEARTIEVLRPDTLEEQELEIPGLIAIAPLREESRALVLIRSGSTWELREVLLATGATLLTHGSGGGVPTTLAVSPSNRFAFFGVIEASQWRVIRLDREGVLPTIEVARSALGPDGVRGLWSIGDGTVAVTAEDALFEANFAKVPPAISAVRSGLLEPSGVTGLPGSRAPVYVAETAADRIVAIDLDACTALPVAVVSGPSAGAVPLPSPRSIDLVDQGTRILAVTEPSLGAAEIREVVLGSPADVLAGPSADPIVVPTALEAFDPRARFVTGPGEMQLLAPSSPGHFAAAGGLLQRRTIAPVGSIPPAYDPDGQIVTVTVAFDPPWKPGQRWRIDERLHRSSAVEGEESSFVWNTMEASGDGSVFLRGLALDTDAGLSTLQASLDVSDAFELDTILLDAPGVTEVKAGDLDGDGDLDVVAASEGKLRIFFQSSNGTFASAPDRIVGGTATAGLRSIAIADVDGNGRNDLVVASAGCTIYYQDANGAFTGPLVLSGAHTFTCADVDRNGHTDLVGIASGQARIHSQVAPGQFSFVTVPVASLGTNTHTITVSDVDANGLPDLVSANETNLSVVFQGPLGTFSTPLVLGNGNVTYHPETILATDIDADGRVDVLAGSEGSGDGSNGKVTMFFQKTNGTLELPGGLPDVTLGSFGLSYGPYFVEAVDLDGDHDLDVITANGFVTTVTAFHQTSPRAFQAVPGMTLTNGGAFDSPRGVSGADLEGDGDVDLLCAYTTSGKVRVYRRPSAGTPEGFRRTELSIPLSINSSQATIADLDGDGDLDVAATSAPQEFATTNTAVFLQAAPATFDALPTQALGSNQQVSPITSADLNGDGKIDLIRPDRYFLQISPGVFQVAGTPLPGSSFGSNSAPILAIDVDGDGRTDIVRGAEILLQSGSLQFTPLVTGAPQVSNVQSVALEDLEGDGDLDYMASTNASVLVFRQLVPGSFEPAASVVLAASNGLRTIRAKDLDADGRTDLAGATSAGLAVYFQRPDGGFEANPLAIAIATAGASTLDVADMNSDGRLDLVATASAGDRIVIFTGIAPRVFDPSPRVLLPPPSASYVFRGCYARDLDGDADVDLVAPAGSGPTNPRVVLFFNAH